jgi:hypothetical protein
MTARSIGGRETARSRQEQLGGTHVDTPQHGHATGGSGDGRIAVRPPRFNRHYFSHFLCTFDAFSEAERIYRVWVLCTVEWEKKTEGNALKLKENASSSLETMSSKV